CISLVYSYKSWLDVVAWANT
nr:hypothetical protein [Mus musculus]